MDQVGAAITSLLYADPSVAAPQIDVKTFVKYLLFSLKEVRTLLVQDSMQQIFTEHLLTVKG